MAKFRPFLARLLILIKKGGLLQLKFGVVGVGVNINLLVGAITRKVFHVSFPNLFCMLLMTTSRTSSIMAEKNFKMADLLRFFTFYVNNLTLWAR